ncbi:MAG TPA: xanthine dehydrogenase family protein subunit M [Thermodesulfobacteriota bacterium]
MIPPRFDYHAPASLDEALSLLAQYGDDARVLSGGQSLIPLLKLRLASPRVLVDINRIAPLARLEEADGSLVIGALVREADLETAAAVRARYPILLDTAGVIADPLVRNLATVCGNVAHADPANDHPATMLAVGAEAVVVSRRGTRRIRAADLFTGPFTTALAPDEILAEMRVPTPPALSGGAYVKLERKVGDFAIAAVAAQVTLGADGTCQRAGIGLTNVGLTPIEARQAASSLIGRRLDDAAVAEAARLAADAAEPTADHRGSVEYRRDLVRVLTARALRRAAARAGADGTTAQAA